MAQKVRNSTDEKHKATITPKKVELEGHRWAHPGVLVSIFLIIIGFAIVMFSFNFPNLNVEQIQLGVVFFGAVLFIFYLIIRVILQNR